MFILVMGVQQKWLWDIAPGNECWEKRGWQSVYVSGRDRICLLSVWVCLLRSYDNEEALTKSICPMSMWMKKKTMFSYVRTCECHSFFHKFREGVNVSLNAHIPRRMSRSNIMRPCISGRLNSLGNSLQLCPGKLLENRHLHFMAKFTSVKLRNEFSSLAILPRKFN